MHLLHWSDAPKAFLYEPWTASPHTAVRLSTGARQAPIDTPVFRRPRVFPAAVPFGPWPEAVDTKYVYSHDLRDDDMGICHGAGVVKECYGYIEKDLAM